MGHALILIESLAAAVLLVALVVAWTSRWRWSLLRWALPLIVAGLVLAPTGVTAYGLWFLARRGPVSWTSFVAVVLWGLAFLIGIIVVIPLGLRAGLASRPWSRRALGLAFLVAAVLTAITLSNLDVAVKAQLAAVRVEAGARALALVPPHLVGVPNAAPVYRKAFAAFTPTDQLPALSTFDRTAFDPADRKMRAFLDSQQRGLTLLREAAAIPHCAFERDWSGDTAPLDLARPELPALQHGATLLAYDALARASRKDAHGAIDDVAAIFAIARHIHDPLLIDLLTAARIEHIGTQALEDILARIAIEPADLARLNLKTADSFRDQLRRTLAMEEAWGLAAIVMIATGRMRASSDFQAQTHMDALGEALLATPIYRVFFLEDDLATYRRHMRTMRDNVALPTAAMFDAFDRHEHQLRATRGGGILAGLLIPAAYRVASYALDVDARRALVRVAIAAVSYKAKLGHYPEAIGDLVPEFLPEVVLDPYDGRSLRLRSTRDGVLLYSIGRDRKNDHSRPYDEAKHEGDLTFRLP